MPDGHQTVTGQLQSSKAPDERAFLLALQANEQALDFLDDVLLALAQTRGDEFIESHYQ